jgi:NAD-dependent dihydropyrimidine dehydrogenase PreA subunit
MKKSTKNIIRMHGWRLDHAVHNYIYFVYYDVYITLFLKAGRFLERWFSRLWIVRRAFKYIFDRYHAKVLTESDVRKIITLQEDLIIGPDKSTRIIPFQYANKIIIKEPQFIAVMDCPCRLHRDNGCQPTDLCIAVGRTTAEFWLEHCEKYHVRKITQDEALKIVMDARKRGCITTAWFKVETGGRTGVICSCCPCCCGGIEGMKIGRKFDKDLSNIAPSGYTVEIDPDKCKLCKQCTTVCAFDGIYFVSESERIYDRAACMGCGLCVEQCEQSALALIRDTEKGDPLDLDFIRETM